MNDLFMFTISGIATFLLLVFRKKKYDIRWKSIVIILLIVGCAGYLGAMFGSYLSYGSWRGIRFYSKALFVTITLWVVSKTIKGTATNIMDYYAPIDILALVVMKINCLITGCCAGVELCTNENGEKIFFPSQIIELIVAVIIFLVVILLEKKSKCTGYRYYIYLLIYGSTRFVLDYFRSTPSNKVALGGMIISITQLFCIALVIMGVWGVYRARKQKQSISIMNDCG